MIFIGRRVNLIKIDDFYSRLNDFYSISSKLKQIGMIDNPVDAACLAPYLTQDGLAMRENAFERWKNGLAGSKNAVAREINGLSRCKNAFVSVTNGFVGVTNAFVGVTNGFVRGTNAFVSVTNAFVRG